MASGGRTKRMAAEPWLLAQGQEAQEAEDGNLFTPIGHSKDESHDFLPRVFDFGPDFRGTTTTLVPNDGG